MIQSLITYNHWRIQGSFIEQELSVVMTPDQIMQFIVPLLIVDGLVHSLLHAIQSLSMDSH